MRNRILTQALMVLFTCLFGIAGAQVSRLAVGTFNGTVGSITDPASAQRVLLANLPAGASVSDLKIGYSEEDGKFYLVSRVSQSKVTGTAIQLTQEAGTLYAVAGPGVQVQCIGDPCSACSIEIRKWKPWCVCGEAGGHCNQIITATISL